jgi:hypothetical protein
MRGICMRNDYTVVISVESVTAKRIQRNGSINFQSFENFITQLCNKAKAYCAAGHFALC